MDDAVSVHALPGGGGWEVGVHIADVSHFVKVRRCRFTLSNLI